MELGKEYFGPLWKYIANEEITDVDYNGREIWLTNIYNERYRVNQAYVDENMTLAFAELSPAAHWFLPPAPDSAC